MPSNYEQIRKENKRAYGEDTDHLAIFGSLYSDQTHFVYELLQNAEDAGATKVHFTLLLDQLQIRHNGKPFTSQNVRGICGIGKSTKVEDLTQIGKFGVGFKSVFAYTSSPEIHSVNPRGRREDFCIKQFVRPEAAPLRDPGPGWTTLIILPFDHGDVPAEEAASKIAGRLQHLNARTMLFLRSIKTIEYRLPDATSGFYGRKSRPLSMGRMVTVSGQGSASEEKESWLIFDEAVQTEDVENDIFVEVAFKLRHGGKLEKNSIVQIPSSPLVVFFPTEKETNLGFLLQGPYRTTPSRNAIKEDDPWNVGLIAKSAKLVITALRHLKAMQLLTVDVLECMPTLVEEFPLNQLFRPIYDEVRRALIKEPLLPTDSGTFVAGKDAKVGRGEALRKLLSPKVLTQLYPKIRHPKWLSGDFTEGRKALYDYLLADLGIEEITPQRLAQDLSQAFLAQQDDQWMIKFYHFLVSQESLWRKRSTHQSPGPLQNKAILRLQDGSHVTPFQADGTPNAYLPGANQTGEYPTIRTAIAQDSDAADFLQRLGMRQVDERDVITRLLNSWYRADGPRPTQKAHLEHMQLFASWYQKTADPKPFRPKEGGYSLFLGRKGDRFYLAKDCYLDQPYAETTLSLIYEQRRFRDKAWYKQAIWDGYTAIDGFADFAKAAGLVTSLQIEQRSIHDGHPKGQAMQKGTEDARHTKLGADKDFMIPDLKALLERRRIEISRLVWQCVSAADAEVVHACYTPNAQYQVRRELSSLILVLRNAKWIPDQDGKFYTPGAMTRELLPTDFVFDNQNGWLTAIGFGEKAKQSEQAYQQRQQAAQLLGIKDLDMIELIKAGQDDPEVVAKLRSLLESTRPRVAFPEYPVQDAQRRHVRVLKQIVSAPDKDYGQKPRSVRTSQPEIEPAVLLRNYYTNADDEMVCQICRNKMPFRKRNGEYYFEAVEMFPLEQLPKEHAIQYLALCPVCAAKYKEFIKREAGRAEELLEQMLRTTRPEVPVNFYEEEAKIRFVAAHWHDIQAILGELTQTAVV